MNILVSEPTFPTPTGNSPLSKEDVWGKFTEYKFIDGDYYVGGEKIHSGMVLARQYEKCPIWSDILEFKDATISGPKSKAEEIAYWIEYVKGADAITRVKEDGDKIHFRCEYTCW